MARQNSMRGFSLVELLSAMAASMILVLGFSSVILLSRQQLTDTNTRVGLGYDQVLIDRYVRTKLTSTVSDSMKIYADLTAEGNDVTSSTGTILRAVDADSTVYHLSINNNTLAWLVDSTNHNPIDCTVNNLAFREKDGHHGKILDISMDLVSDSDTLACAWTITLRN
jgi:hypothetical protein